MKGFSNLPACAIPLLFATGILGQPLSSPLFIGNTYASYSNPRAIVAAGQITTLYFIGAHTIVPRPVRASTLPLPTTLAGFSVGIFNPRLTLDPLPVPILAVSQSDFCAAVQLPTSTPGCILTALTVQITGASLPNINGPANPTELVVLEGSKILFSSFVIVHPVAVHIMTACDIELAEPNGGVAGGAFCDPLITHADGTPAGTFTAPLGRVPKPGETLVMYALGLGPTTPGAPPGDASPNPPAVARGSFSLLFAYSGYPPQVGTPTFAGLTPGAVGLYQINFMLPPPTGEHVSRQSLTVPPGNLVITLASNDWNSSDSTFLNVDLSNP